jgi:hypothetical protein
LEVQKTPELRCEESQEGYALTRLYDVIEKGFKKVICSVLFCFLVLWSLRMTLLLKVGGGGTRNTALEL